MNKKNPLIPSYLFIFPIAVIAFFIVSILFMACAFPKPPAITPVAGLQFNSQIEYEQFRDDLINKRKTQKLNYDEFKNLLQVYNYEIKKHGGLTLKNINKNNFIDCLETHIKKQAPPIIP